MHDDEFARLAHHEQVAAAHRETAAMLASFRNHLILAGFDREEAFDLTRDFHGELLARSREDDE